MSSVLYPPGPAAVPADLTRPSGRYRLMVAATLLSILLFMALYAALVAGSIWLFIAILTTDLRINGFWGLVLYIGSAAAAMMFTVFLIKFMFKRPERDDSQRLRLVPAAHPQLVGFIEQLCAETGAPRPKHIYLTPDVNAAVFYQHPMLSLVWPARKSLLIGVGLINALTLSEFKAVLAHEFGHFAQRSMRLGSYVYTANRLLHDVVYGRDKWDELLASWRQLDLRVSVLAWVLTGMVWLVRKVLELAYRGVSLMHAHLSREMEFQADRVAVQVAGSDAIVNALYQINRASGAYQTALGQLSTALEHQLVSDDVYHHQLLRLADCPPAPPAFRPGPAGVAEPGPQQLFTAEEVTLKAEMYASHPSDFLREQHAKTPYVPAPADDRSPWLLFSRPEEVRRLVTRKLYPESAGQYEPQPAAEVEAFLAAEQAELTYADLYAESYDGRIITAVEPDEVERLASQLAPDAPLLALRAELYGPELRQRTSTHQQRLQDLAKLALFARGEVREPAFVVEGQTYPAGQHAEVAARLQREEAEYQRWVSEFDERAAALNWRLLAGQPEQRAAWQARYALLLHLRLGFQESSSLIQELRAVVDEVVALGQVSEQAARRYVTRLQELRLRLRSVSTAARQTQLLPLRHLEEVGTVADYVLRDFTFQSDPVLSGEWINEFGNGLEIVLERYRRLYFKNLGVLLRLQEEAAEAYAAVQEPVALAATAGAR